VEAAPETGAPEAEVELWHPAKWDTEVFVGDELFQLCSSALATWGGHWAAAGRTIHLPGSADDFKTFLRYCYPMCPASFPGISLHDAAVLLKWGAEWDMPPIREACDVELRFFQPSRGLLTLAIRYNLPKTLERCTMMGQVPAFLEPDQSDLDLGDDDTVPAALADDSEAAHAMRQAVLDSYVERGSWAKVGEAKLRTRVTPGATERRTRAAKEHSTVETMRELWSPKASYQIGTQSEFRSLMTLRPDDSGWQKGYY